MFENQISPLSVHEHNEIVDNLNLSLSLHNTHNHCHPFINKVKKQLFLPFKVCDIVIVIHTTNLYNLGKELITVCWNKQQHMVKLIIPKINLIQSFFYSNDNDNNNKKQHFNCSVLKKKTRSKYYYNTDLRINNNFDNSYSDCRPCQFAPSAS